MCMRKTSGLGGFRLSIRHVSLLACSAVILAPAHAALLDEGASHQDAGGMAAALEQALDSPPSRLLAVLGKPPRAPRGDLSTLKELTEEFESEKDPAKR